MLKRRHMRRHACSAAVPTCRRRYHIHASSSHVLAVDRKYAGCGRSAGSCLPRQRGARCGANSAVTPNVRRVARHHSRRCGAAGARPGGETPSRRDVGKSRAGARSHRQVVRSNMEVNGEITATKGQAAGPAPMSIWCPAQRHRRHNVRERSGWRGGQAAGTAAAGRSARGARVCECR